MNDKNKDLLARLRLLRKTEKLNIDDFAAELSEKPQRIKDILGSRQRMPGDFLCNVVDIFGVDANWLLLGEGPMYRKPAELMESLTSMEKALLNNYRVCSNRKQEALDMMVEVLASDELELLDKENKKGEKGK